MALIGNSSDKSGNEINIISSGTSIKGEVVSESSIILHGKIEGKVSCKNTLTIGETGSIEGDVEATNAIISGKLKGKINVKEKLALESKSSLTGELKARKLIIDEGAKFDGTSDMGAGEPTLTKPEKK